MAKIHIGVDRMSKFVEIKDDSDVIIVNINNISMVLKLDNDSCKIFFKHGDMLSYVMNLPIEVVLSKIGGV